jgi:hypothetical protein
MLKRHMNLRSESREGEGNPFSLMNQFQKNPLTHSPSISSRVRDGKHWLSLLYLLYVTVICVPSAVEEKWFWDRDQETLTPNESTSTKWGSPSPQGDTEMLTS